MVCVAFAIFLGGCATPEQGIPEWKAAWDKLHEGMSPKEVKALFPDPKPVIEVKRDATPPTRFEIRGAFGFTFVLNTTSHRFELAQWKCYSPSVLDRLTNESAIPGNVTETRSNLKSKLRVGMTYAEALQIFGPETSSRGFAVGWGTKLVDPQQVNEIKISEDYSIDGTLYKLHFVYGKLESWTQK
jgi:hypothetical protein